MWGTYIFLLKNLVRPLLFAGLSEFHNAEWSECSWFQVKGWKRRARMGGKGSTQTELSKFCQANGCHSPSSLSLWRWAEEKKEKCRSHPLQLYLM
ncbi:hypothetical protein SLA2020_447650 [Shorea laevis]